MSLTALGTVFKYKAHEQVSNAWSLSPMVLSTACACALREQKDVEASDSRTSYSSRLLSDHNMEPHAGPCYLLDRQWKPDYTLELHLLADPRPVEIFLHFFFRYFWKQDSLYYPWHKTCKWHLRRKGGSNLQCWGLASEWCLSLLLALNPVHLLAACWELIVSK